MVVVVVVVSGYGVGLCERYVCGIFLFYSILYTFIDNFTLILFVFMQQQQECMHNFNEYLDLTHKHFVFVPYLINNE